MNAKTFVIQVTLVLAAFPAGVLAQKPPTPLPPESHPRYATARCTDGTYWSDPQPTGACSGHGGVYQWLRADRPKDATARCTDLTWSRSLDPQLACVQHGGVRFWVRPLQPRNVTGMCGDGSDWTGPDLQSACAGRGGVAAWYGGEGGPLPQKHLAPLRIHP